MTRGLTDAFGRHFEYLRLSVTDLCNFKCTYCLPEGCKKETSEPLRVSEIKNLVAAFGRLGVWKIRLTGGEPTVRKDLLEIVQAVSSVPEIKRIALTTNGFSLNRNALYELKAAGLTAVNLSIDSLDAKRFQIITGRDGLLAAKQAVTDAVALGFESVKVNAVLMKGINDGEISAYAAWVKELPISVRYIELMQTADNAALFKDRYLSSQWLSEELTKRDWKKTSKASGDGPALVFKKDGYAGSIGVVAPYSEGFCDSCNRLRVTSTGALRLCLFGEADYDLRPLLQSGEQGPELKQKVRELLERKSSGHRLKEGIYGNTKNLAAFGG